MVQEFETKVLDINISKVKEKLLSLGATQHPEVLLKRHVFDIESEHREWIRLRTDGSKATLTYKKKDNNSISGTEEIEVVVSNFEEMYQILSKIHFKNHFYHENKRILLTLNKIEFTIDTWPGIPPYIEIESSCEEKVIEGLKLLDLEGKDIGNVTVSDVYQKYGKDLHNFKDQKP